MSADHGARAPRPRVKRCPSCAQRRRRLLEERPTLELEELTAEVPRRLIHWRRADAPTTTTGAAPTLCAEAA